MNWVLRWGYIHSTMDSRALKIYDYLRFQRTHRVKTNRKFGWIKPSNPKSECWAYQSFMGYTLFDTQWFSTPHHIARQNWGFFSGLKVEHLEWVYRGSALYKGLTSLRCAKIEYHCLSNWTILCEWIPCKQTWLARKSPIFNGTCWVHSKNQHATWTCRVLEKEDYL